MRTCNELKFVLELRFFSAKWHSYSVVTSGAFDPGVKIGPLLVFCLHVYQKLSVHKSYRSCGMRKPTVVLSLVIMLYKSETCL